MQEGEEEKRVVLTFSFTSQSYCNIFYFRSNNAIANTNRLTFRGRNIFRSQLKETINIQLRKESGLFPPSGGTFFFRKQEAFQEAIWSSLSLR